MSTVLILAPVVIGAWPAISAAAAGAAAALGLALKHEIKDLAKDKQEEHESVEISLQESEITQDLHSGQEMVFAKDDCEIRIRRDERGRCVVCASGKGYTKAQLQQMAEGFSEKLSQCFVYNKVMSELKNKSFNVVNEEVMDDQSIRIHVRKWMD
jgi:ABC-type transporter MlaC component